jgi:hypothetical protein
MLMLITSILHRGMPFARLMNTSLNITSSVHLMILLHYVDLIARF